jgi:hypothetical protein
VRVFAVYNTRAPAKAGPRTLTASVPGRALFRYEWACSLKVTRFAATKQLISGARDALT